VSFSNLSNFLFRWTLWIYLPNLKFVALRVPETIGGTQKIWAFPGCAHTPFSPKFFSNFLSIFTRFRDIAAFVLQCATFSHPTSIDSPKFPHVPLVVGGWPLGYDSEGVGLIVRPISFKDFQLCDPDLPTSQTDGRTDGRTTCSVNTALCTKHSVTLSSSHSFRRQ